MWAFNFSAPTLLATLTTHIAGGINCVRWSPDGNSLAACGDDKQVHLYQLKQGTGQAFGTTNIENWKLIYSGVGHGGGKAQKSSN